jgi:hypothetical protein
MSETLVGYTFVPIEQARIPVVGNLDGCSIPAFDDDIKTIGYIRPDVPLLCVEDNGTTFIKVLGPVGPVWVMKKHLKHF